MYIPPAGGHEFVEIQNLTATPFDIALWELSDTSSAIDDYRVWTSSLPTPGFSPVLNSGEPFPNPEVNLSTGIPFVNYADTSSEPLGKTAPITSATPAGPWKMTVGTMAASTGSKHLPSQQSQYPHQ